MPVIVKKIGAEANGYVTLANNFVSYATIITIALNSVANRFIMIKYHNDDMKGANVYFSSVLYANIIMTAVMFIPIGVFITFMDSIKTTLTVAVSTGICIVIKYLLNLHAIKISWLHFILMVLICVVVAGIFNFVIRLNKNEKKKSLHLHLSG